MARILIEECKQEISSFHPVLSCYEDFLVDRGSDVLAYHRRVHTEVGGALSVFEPEPDLELIGGYSARGITSAGTLNEASYQRIASEFCEAARSAGPVDGVYLALHGALASTRTEDTEGDLVRRVRAIVGEAVPIVVSLDLHGILTDEILAASDAVVVYQTNPHTDFYETGQRAARVLLHLVRGGQRPTQIRVPVPALVRGIECTTTEGVFGQMVRRAAQSDALSSGLFIGNPFTDVAELASNVLLVTTGDVPSTVAFGESLALELWSQRERMQQPLLPVAECVRQAAAAKGRVVIVDAADATSSGAPGDSNAILAQLFAAECPRSALVPIVDAPAACKCFEDGIGATVTVQLGGSLDPRFKPVAVTGRVMLLFDGEMRSESHGEAWFSGPTAVLDATPHRIVITTRAVSLYDRTLFLAAGQDPAHFDINIVKSPICQKRFFEDGAELVLHADAPGATSANVAGLGHRKAIRPLYPLDPEMEYQPQPRIFPPRQP